MWNAISLVRDLNSCLSDSKSPQVSRTLLSIPVDLNNAPLISKSPPRPCAQSFDDCTECANYILYSFFNSLERSWYLSLVSLSVSFTLSSAATANLNYYLIFSFILCFQQSFIRFFWRERKLVIFCVLRIFVASFGWYFSITLIVPF